MEAKTLGGTRGDELPLFNTLADTLAEKEVGGDSWDDAHAKVDNLADTLPKVKAKTLGDARGDAHALVELWLRR